MDDSGSQPTSPTTMQDGPRGPNDGTEPVSACIVCRRRKLKCTKEVPKCQQCRKTSADCVYDNKRNKSGMKAGAIEGLHRRLDTLEKRVEENESRTVPRQGPHYPDSGTSAGQSPPDVYNILSSLARELGKFNEVPRHTCVPNGQGSPDVVPHEEHPPLKRRRLDAINDSFTYRHQPQESAEISSIPDEKTLDGLLRAYFSHIHPWIPMIHEGRLRKKLLMHYDSVPEQQQKVRMLLAVIRLASARFIEDRQLASTCMEITDEGQNQARDWVILQAMKRPSVESLQALIVLAFHDIGSGDASLAWPIIGSLTRTAEYLQLTVERTPDRQSQPLVQPYTLLAPSQDWTQEEERRRVFWTIFNLDRYCSVTMGWNTSLTSHDVNRRLPCDGITWRKEDPVETPFFGIWDKAAGRIGNPIAYLPSHSAPSPDHHRHPDTHAQAPPTTPPTAASTPNSPFSPTTTIDMSTVGAFAYSIEATESLSRVNTYFLQQPRPHDTRSLPSWLTRFKELDLRLVHWKMFLPRKWKADNVTARQGAKMDPNLTLAHVTHNASMILLHQVVAFPREEWRVFGHRLPSALSVDTCHAAAVEIEVIARNFLKGTGGEGEGGSMPVSSLFVFCVYIAARFLLVFWRHVGPGGGKAEDRVLAPEFRTLLEILHDMARRWSGPHGLGSGRKANLAERYAQKLDDLHARCLADEHYRIDPLEYTAEMDHVTSGTERLDGTSDGHESVQGVRSNHVGSSGQMQYQHGLENQQIHQQPEMACAVPLEFPRVQEHFAPQNIPQYAMSPRTGSQFAQFPTSSSPESSRTYPTEHQYRSGSSTGEVGMIYQTLMDQQFLGLDRVISYDDGMFGSEFDSGTW